MKDKNAGYIYVDGNELFNLYWVKGYTVSKIAKEHMFCSHVTVLNRMKEHGIPSRKKGEIRKRYKYFYNGEYYQNQQSVDDAICEYIESAFPEIIHSDFMCEESGEFESQWDEVEEL